MEDQLLTLLHRANARARRLRDAGRFPGAMGRLLSALCNSEGKSQIDLAESLHIRPQSLTDLVLALEKDGYLLRRTDPADRRKYLLFLTETGIQAEAALRAERHARALVLFSALSPDEQSTLAHLLGKVALGDECREGKES